MIVYDIETALNRMIFGFRKLGGDYLIVETTGRLTAEEKAEIDAFIDGDTLVGFNNAGFDTFLLYFAMTRDASAAEVFELGQAIITGDGPAWKVARDYNARRSTYREIDLMNYCKEGGGLKVYEARMGMSRVKTLPFDVDAPITDEMLQGVIEYLQHDLAATELLLEKLMPEIEARETLGEMFSLDLMGTGAAGAAEDVVLNEYIRTVGGAIDMSDIKSMARRFQNCIFSVTLAQWVHDVCSRTPVMDLVRVVEASKFQVTEGKRTGPDISWPETITFNGFTCAFALGGVHSVDAAGRAEGNLRDFDVSSYYPHLLLAEGGAPEHLDAGIFRGIYKGVLENRLKAKHEGRKLEAEALKLVLNSTFGKCNEKWSGLYSPRSFLHVTLSGQLALLALVYKMSEAGAVPLSANTDGILVSCPPDAEESVAAVVAAWEAATGFPLERKDMAAYRRLNVNAYLSIYADGEIKGKGQLNPKPGLTGNPNDLVIPMAVANFMRDGTPVAETIRAAAAERNLFLFAKVLTTTAKRMVQGDETFGKVVRAYRCANCPPISAVTGAEGKLRTVANARRVFVDLDQWPEDIDIDSYILEAESHISTSDIPIENSRNNVAREIEAAGFATRGTGSASDIRTGGNFSGSGGIAIDVAKRYGIAACPAGAECPGDLLMIVYHGDNPAWGIINIAGLDRKEMKVLRSVEGIVFNGPIEVWGDDVRFEIVSGTSAPVEEKRVAPPDPAPVNEDRAVAGPPTRIDNDHFLQAIFGEEWRDAYTVSFTTPPNADNVNWSGGPAQLARGDYHRAGANNYFGLSLFGRDEEGAYRRRGETFKALHAILLDDIGTKVGDARAVGWGEPSFLTETSPGNHQAIYRLAEPVTDRARAESLIAMVLGAELSDKGSGGVTRVARMPIGSNNKTTLPVPFEQVVRVWAPERTYTVAEILRWMGKTEADLDAAAATVMPLSRAANREAAERHPVIEAFKSLGHFIKPKRNGWFDVVCPWNQEHSKGRFKDGAALTVYDDGRWAFKCNHGNCSRKKHLPNGREVPERGSFAVWEWLRDQGQLVSRASDPVWGSGFAGMDFPDDGEMPTMGTGVDDSNLVNLRMFSAERRGGGEGDGDELNVGNQGAGNHHGEAGSRPSTIVKTDKGKPVACLATVMHFLHNDRQWAGVLAHDLFSDRRMLMVPTPTLDGRKPNDFSPRPISDEDIVDAAVWFEAKLKIKIGKGVVGDAMLRRAAECPFDPLVDRLRALRWDGRPRLKGWLQTYCGASVGEGQSAEYLGAVGEKWMISAVARAMLPACQVDTMLVFVSKQGRGKSTMARELCFDPAWFSDSTPHRLESKDAADHVRGLWIIEFAELAAMTRGEVEDTKAFISRRYEKFRPAYARSEVTYARRCVFFGSTNTTEFLRDNTGNRRFWPVNIERDIDIAGIRADRDQLWAEAVVQFDLGKQWHLAGEEAALAEGRQEAHHLKDARIDLLRDKLGDRATIHMTEALNLLFMPHDMGSQKIVADLMRALGWDRKHTRKGWVWVAPEGSQA